MNIYLRAAVLAGAALLTATGSALADNSGSVLSDSSDPATVAKFRKEAEAKIQCPPIADTATKWAAYVESSEKKWDRAAMGCALAYGTDAALDLSVPGSTIWAFLTFRADNIKKNLSVLGSNIEYFDVLSKSYAQFYQGVELESELGLRWEQTRKRSEAILAHVAPLQDQLPELRVLRAAYQLAATQRETPPEQQTKASLAAIKDLEAVVKEHPDTLNGLPQFLLGQALDRLPEFLGGDADRAISLLEEAHRANPSQLDYDLALITAYIGNRVPDKAVPVIDSVLALDPAGQNPQDYVDDLKYITGLAQRISRVDLARTLNEKTSAFIATHSFVLQRKTVFVFGYTSQNPLTGEAPDAVK